MAFMAIQLAADIAPNGARHCANARTPGRRHRPAEAQGGEGRLPDRAEAQDVTAEPAGHRQHGRDDRAARTGEVAAAVDPGRVEAQRLLDRGDAALAHAHAAGAGIGRQAVDVVERQPGVGDRLRGRRRP